MRLDYAFENPPYSIGGKIAEYSLKSLAPDGKCVCLMPLSKYKTGLYKHVESFELADPKMFSDASITNNLCICVLCSSEVNRYSWNDLQFESFDRNFLAFYKANNKRVRHYVFKGCNNAVASDYDKDLDFMESNRLCDGAAGGGFGKGGSGWRWNYEGSESLGAGIATIHFNTKKGKDNFQDWWYFGKKGKSLSSLLQIGLHLKTVNATCTIAIPQIDWNTISDHPLWKQGDYDGAVLDVMGLKWDEDKSGVLEKQDITKKVYNIN